MKSWLIYLVGSLPLVLAAGVGLLLFRLNRPGASGAKETSGDTRILCLLLWLASLSILAYIAFAFGRR